MTKFECLKSKNIDEFAKWLDKYGVQDFAPWHNQFDEKYCCRCETEEVYDAERNRTIDYAWCEITGKCRFFQDMDKIPCCEQVIKMWLESEDNDGV